jgi:hypothetical protein
VALAPFHARRTRLGAPPVWSPASFQAALSATGCARPGSALQCGATQHLILRFALSDLATQRVSDLVARRAASRVLPSGVTRLRTRRRLSVARAALFPKRAAGRRQGRLIAMSLLLQTPVSPRQFRQPHGHSETRRARGGRANRRVRRGVPVRVRVCGATFGRARTHARVGVSASAILMSKQRAVPVRGNGQRSPTRLLPTPSPWVFRRRLGYN